MPPLRIGPGLRAFGETDPDKLIWRMRTARSKNVLIVRLKKGEIYPVLAVGQDERWIKLYDLSSPLPVLRTLHCSQVVALEKTQNWAHSSVMSAHTEGKLLALVPYLLWLISDEPG